MRKLHFVLLAVAVVATALPAAAELQNVTIGGEITIRGNYYRNLVTSPGGAELRWPALQGFNTLWGRPIGTGAPGNFPGIVSAFSWDSARNDLTYVEQRTRMNVNADFTNQVSAFIEFDYYNIWGDDFRSDYITGADMVRANNDDVQLYQAYIEANEMWGMPLRARVGRQELSFGSEWLVGTKDGATEFTGRSFDALRLTFGDDLYTLDAFAAQLADTGVAEQDGDVWFYGVYGSYLGLEDITIDAYYLFLRDPRRITDTNFPWFVEWVEDIFGLDDYSTTRLNTIGLRGAGVVGGFDFEAEVAYQWGNAGQVGSLFTPFLYGDNRADFDNNWGVNVEVGYTFNQMWQPRVYLGYAYLDGEDNRDISWFDWWWPFTRPEASVSFNRLFSNWEYTEFFANTDESNMHIYRGGVSAMPTEALELELTLAYFRAVEAFAAPIHWNLGGFRIPLLPTRSYWTQQNSKELGWELGLYGTYHYTEDLKISAGWARLFTSSGLTDGNFVVDNGLGFTGGSDNSDADYLFIETQISF